MNKPIIKVELFADIVAATESFVIDKRTGQTVLQLLQAYDSKITGIHYKHGHPLEIINTLTGLTKGVSTKFDRFPLIALFQDFPETIGGAPGFYSDDAYHLIMAYGTNPNYKAAQRYEVTFKPILYPMYFAFMECLRLSGKFEIISGSDTYSHVKIDRLFWGREGLWGNESNVMNDKVDCIEIKDLKLRIKTQNC